MYKSLLLVGLMASNMGCSDLPPQLEGQWELNVERTVAHSGLDGILSEANRNEWVKQLDKKAHGVTYGFSGSRYRVSNEAGAIEGPVSLVKQKEKRYTLALGEGNAIHEVRVWFKDSEMIMEEHRQSMVLTRK